MRMFCKGHVNHPKLSCRGVPKPYVFFGQLDSLLSEIGLCSIGVFEGRSSIPQVFGGKTPFDIFSMSHSHGLVVEGRHCRAKELMR
jgi:hypothetical protein